MSNLDTTWYDRRTVMTRTLPVAGHASATSEHLLVGGLVGGCGTVDPTDRTNPTDPAIATGTDVPFGGGLMAGFGRTVATTPGTSVWRPPDC